MGTNYYHHGKPPCEACGRPYEPAHIGKSSAGWTFSFHGTDEVRSYRDWLRVLESGGEIRDEYDRPVTLEDFRAMVAMKADEPNNHARHCRVHHPDYAEQFCWLDDEGHSFSAGDFS